MMRIISFDVGIKNMAYCLMEIGGETTKDASSIEILQWNVLNLSGEDAPASHLCTCITGITKKTPNGKICGKKAKYGGPCGGGGGSDRVEKFCLKHATNHERWRLPKKETKLAELKKKKVEELAMEWKKIDMSIHPEKRDGCTILMRKQEVIDCLAKYYSETEFTILPVAKQRKAADINLIEIGQNIRTQLDNYLGNMRLDYVIIENQISTIATRMKTIQGMLAQYFIMRENGSGHPHHPHPHIEFISSHNKLKGFTLEHNVESTQEHDKKKYKANKMNGVDICRRFLDANQAMGANWKEEFERNVKKDDLADGFLQGIFYLKREKIIIYAENLKINSV